MSHNPFDGIAKFKEWRGSIRYLRVDERKRLLAETAKDPDLHAFTILALSTACRAGELLKLTWRDVDLDEKQLRFAIRRTTNPVWRGFMGMRCSS
jgi:integrase